MAVSRETVTVVFKEPPMRLFTRAEDVRDARNALRFELHDPPGIKLEFLGKRPGPSSPSKSRRSTSTSAPGSAPSSSRPTSGSSTTR